MARRLLYPLTLLLLFLLAAVLPRPAASVSETQGDLAGRVRDHRGRSIANATVRVLAGPELGSARTDAQGHYVLKDLEPGVYEILAFKTGYVSVRERQVPIAAGETAELDFELEWSDPDTGALEAIVQDAGGHTLAGATVDLFQQTVFQTRGETDAAGSRVFAGLSPGRYRVEVQRPGYHDNGSGLVDVVAGRMATVVVRLNRDPVQVGAIAGLVRDIDGRVVPDATVRVLEGLSGGQDQTSASGRYTLTGLIPADNYTVQAIATGYETATVANVPVRLQSTTPLDFTLLPIRPTKGSIAGTIFDEQGTPLSGVTVTITVGPDFGRQAVSSADGLYVLTDLTPSGEYAILAEKAAYAPAGSFGISVRAGETAVRNLILPLQITAPGTLEGTVREAGSGQPLADAAVEVIDGPSAGLSALTDTSGRYRIEGVRPGDNYILSFRRADYNAATRSRVVVTSGSRTSVDAELERRSSSVGILRGTVTRNGVGGKPLGGVTVTIFDGPTSPVETTTSSDGTYEFRHLQAGTGYKVRVQKRRYVKQEREGVTVTAGQAVVVNFVMRRGRLVGALEGRITDLLQQPVPDATVRLFAGPVTGEEEVTGSDGKFRFDSLPRGEYALEILADGHQRVIEDGIRVNPRRTTRVNIQLVQ